METSTPIANTWRIEDATVASRPAVSFRRRWENARTHVRALDLAQVRADLEALERIDHDHPGWYIGFHIPGTAVSRLSGLWAQYPGVVVVTADFPDELKRRISAALITHGL